RAGEELGHLEPALRRHAAWCDRIQQDEVLLLDGLRVEVPTPLGAGELREQHRCSGHFRIRPAVLDEDPLELTEQRLLTVRLGKRRGDALQLGAHRLHRRPDVWTNRPWAAACASPHTGAAAPAPTQQGVLARPEPRLERRTAIPATPALEL